METRATATGEDRLQMVSDRHSSSTPCISFLPAPLSFLPCEGRARKFSFILLDPWKIRDRSKLVAAYRHEHGFTARCCATCFIRCSSFFCSSFRFVLSSFSLSSPLRCACAAISSCTPNSPGADVDLSDCRACVLCPFVSLMSIGLLVESAVSVHRQLDDIAGATCPASVSPSHKCWTAAP